jgi:hypothetical protein
MAGGVVLEASRVDDIDGSIFSTSFFNQDLCVMLCLLLRLQVVPVFNYRRVDLLMRKWDVRLVSCYGCQAFV